MRETDYHQQTLEQLEESYLAADERGDRAAGVQDWVAAWCDGSARLDRK
jgi:hypothetical protein